jgi:hypothetical protein
VSPLKVRGQRGNHHATDVHAQFGQDPCYWVTSHKGSLWGESYVQGRLYLHVHLSVWVDGMDSPDPTYWCVSFHRSAETFDQSGTDTPNISEFPNLPEGARERRHGGVEESVLVDAVKLMKDPEGIISESVPSVVRLQSLDGCLRVWVPSTDLEEAAPRSGIPVGLGVVKELTSDAGRSLPVFVPEDGELRAASEFLRERARVSCGQGIGEVVKGRPQVVQHVTDQQANRIRGWVFGGRERSSDTLTEIDSLRRCTRALTWNEHGSSEEVAPILQSGAGRDGATPPGIKVIFVSDGVVVIAIDPGLNLRTQILQVLERSTQLQFMVERHASRMGGTP